MLWMFALGVLVGRGSSPVSFDTRGFQARLEAIALEHGLQEKNGEKVDLKFYDALNQPVRHEIKGRKEGTGEIVPGRERPAAVSVLPVEAEDAVPVKIGKKQSSINRERLKKEAMVQPRKTADSGSTADSVKVMKTAALAKKIPRPDSKPPAPGTGEKAGMPVKPGRYTIQVAAYKAFKDAVSQMAALEKKGIVSYRVKGEKNGAVWYRVRTGSFLDYKSAKLRLETLKQAKVDGMIIKKE